MKEDLLRHTLTASLAGLVASLGTAAVLGDRGGSDQAERVPLVQREDSRDDEALIEAIAEMKRAISRIEMTLELVKAESRRSVAERPDEEAVASERSEDETPARTDLMGIGRLRAFWTGKDPSSVPLDRRAVRDFAAREQAARDEGVETLRSFWMSSRFRTIGEVLDEFGKPTDAGAEDGQIVLRWEIDGGPSVEAGFVDGLCLRLGAF